MDKIFESNFLLKFNCFSKLISSGSGSDMESSSIILLFTVSNTLIIYLKVIIVCQEFQKELDLKYDKHEHLVKLSRDTTIFSKRIIFLLHRISEEQHKNIDILVEAQEKLSTVIELLRQIASELTNEDPAKFYKSYTNGVQEFVEALSFFVFQKEGRLISFTEIQQCLTFSKKESTEEQEQSRQIAEHSDKFDLSNILTTNNDEKQFMFPLTELDYVLGVADFTGELMRMTVNAVGSGNWTLPFSVLWFIRSIQRCYQSLQPISRDIPRKLQTLNDSVSKIEQVCYSIKLRGSEQLSKHILPAESQTLQEAEEWPDSH